MSLVATIEAKAKEMLEKIKEFSTKKNEAKADIERFMAMVDNLKKTIDTHDANLHMLNGALQAYQDAAKVAQEKEDAAKKAPTETEPVAS